MTNLTKTNNQFTHEIFGNLTTIINGNGDVFFIGKEVANTLGYTNPSKAISDHVREKHRLELDNETLLSFGIDLGQRGGTLISEAGMFSLVMKSKLEKAEEFQDWVSEEVLPTIRKTGSYAIQPLSEIEVAKRYLESLLEKEELKKKIELDKPKVEFFDELVDRKLNLNIRTTAKEIGIKETEFVKFLLDKKYLYRDIAKKLVPYAEYINETPLFTIKESKTDKWAGTQTLITPEGRARFLVLLGGK